MTKSKKEKHLEQAQRTFYWLEHTKDPIEPVFISEAIWRIKYNLKQAFEELSALNKTGLSSNEDIEKRLETASKRIQARNLEFIRTKDL